MIYRNFIQGINAHFELHYKYSNILIGFSNPRMNREALYHRLLATLISLYENLEYFISEHETFETTLKPWAEKMTNELAAKMVKYTSVARVGPMASVAGVFADELFEEIAQYVDAVFIENGGDVALKNSKDSFVMAYPGTNAFQEKVILKLPPGRWGIASSSGKFGHSLSLGQSDLISVVAENANRADSFATAIANQVKPGCDPPELLTKYAELNAVLIIWNGQMWYRGKFELSFC